jgi:hypothetical protein
MRVRMHTHSYAHGHVCAHTCTHEQVANLECYSVVSYTLLLSDD